MARVPWPFLAAAAGMDATRCMMTLTGAIRPTKTSNAVDNGCQPALESVTE
jgi:hypothetical protein